MLKNSPCLGVIGGMGPGATAAFYQRIVDLTDASCDQEHIQAVVLSDTAIPDRTQSILSETGGRVYEALLEDARILHRTGCTTAVIPCNTAHYFIKRLQAESPLPILNMVEETARMAIRKNTRQVGILATDGTISSGLYQEELKRHGISCAILPALLQRGIMTLIYDEIKKGAFGNPAHIQAAEEYFREQNCGGVILACTELSVFNRTNTLPAYYWDAMDILAQKAILSCGGRIRHSMSDQKTGVNLNELEQQMDTWNCASASL